jgi:hypothetical protein
MHTGAVLQSGVHDGIAGIHRPVHAADEALHNPGEILVILEMLVKLHELAGLFHENGVIAVDHHLRNLRIRDDFPQDSQPLHGLRDGVPQGVRLFERKILIIPVQIRVVLLRPVNPLRQLLIDQLLHLFAGIVPDPAGFLDDLL